MTRGSEPVETLFPFPRPELTAAEVEALAHAERERIIAEGPQKANP
jgi:hypothetical protein